MCVAVLGVLGKDGFEMAAAENERPIKTLAPSGAHHTLTDGFARGRRTGLLMIQVPSAANAVSKEAGNLVSRSRIKNLADLLWSAISPWKPHWGFPS